MGIFFVADLKTCEEFDMTMSKKQFYDLAGVPIREIFRILAEEQGKSPDLHAMAARCKEIADALMDKGPDMIHPVVAIARDAKAKGVPVAVASSGVKPTVTGGEGTTRALFCFKLIKCCCFHFLSRARVDMYARHINRVGVQAGGAREVG
jgi:beta-phosphoglucomutase-like phosphatase (HAD superfamily)